MAQGALPGFRDFYPELFAERAYVMKVWREVASRYAFVEYDGPPLEPLELYTKKSGDEIVGQLYNFRDKGDREVALRPEMTPTLARMVAARAATLRKPVRWFSIPQLFRYERQQRGRLREHFQLNVDIVGEADVTADAELLAVAIDIMREFGLTPADVRARVSDRRLLLAILAAIGVADEQVSGVFGVMDKIGRLPLDEVKNRLAAVGLTSAAVAKVVSLALKSESDPESIELELRSKATEYADFPDVVGRVRDLERYISCLAHLGVLGWVSLDFSIVRGLAYYTGIVFELFDAQGELRAICGGGRYDSLLGALGGVELPALGFGMGDVVLTDLLRERGLNTATATPDFWIAAAEGSEEAAAMGDVMATATALRRAGAAVEYALRKQQLGKQRKAAISAGASYFVTLDAEFRKSGFVQVAELQADRDEESSGKPAPAASPLMIRLATLPSTVESLVAVVRQYPDVLK